MYGHLSLVVELAKFWRSQSAVVVVGALAWAKLGFTRPWATDED